MILVDTTVCSDSRRRPKPLDLARDAEACIAIRDFGLLASLTPLRARQP